MTILLIKLTIDGFSGILNAIGGYDALYARRFIMPVLIGIGVSLGSVWWAGFMVLPVIGTLCLGYFGKGFFGRGSWLCLQAVVIGLGCFLTHHLSIWLYLPYIASAFAAGGFLYNVEQLISDFLFGCLLASIIFLVH